MANISINININIKYKTAKAISSKHKKVKKLPAGQVHVVNIDGKTISELKSYCNPPEDVKKVLHATFIILGEKDKLDWRRIKGLLGQKGQESLEQLIGTFRMERLSHKRALAARKVLQGLNGAKVRKVSTGAAALFDWTNYMINEAESRHEHI